MNSNLWSKGRWAGLVLGAAVVTSACSGKTEPAEPAEAQERLGLMLPGLIDGAAEAMAFLDESNAWSRANVALEGIDTVLLPLTSVDTAGEEVPDESFDRSWATRRPFAFPKVASLLARAETDDELEEESPGVEITRFLQERVFIEANHEGGGVYRIHGDLLCEEDELTGLVDPECVDQVERAELRLLAEAVGAEGFDVTLLVGPARSTPLGFVLLPEHVSMHVNLFESKEAIQYLADVAGEEVELPEVLEGAFSVALNYGGAQVAELLVSVSQTIRIQGEWDGAEVSFSTEKKEPLFSLRADGVARKLLASLDVGVTTLRAPWEKIAEDSQATGPLEVSLAGLSGTVALAEGDETFLLSNLGLGNGTTTMKLDGQTLVAIDLNAGAAGRRFGVRLTPGEEAPTIEVTPKFDLSVLFHLAPLAAAGDEVEAHLLDETYRVSLDGAAIPALRVRPADELSGFAGALEILAGQLALSSSKATAPVTVTAGNCLVGDDVTDGEHPVLGAFAAIACP